MNKKRIQYQYLILSFIIHGSIYSIEPKIIGLVPGRNEATILAQCLKALSLYTDAIVYLDDASQDNSVEIARSLAKECNIETIITKEKWIGREESKDRNRLLYEGRKLGGTHFLVIDVDEMITSNCLPNNFLRTKILALKPGERLELNWIMLWRSTERYRFDNSVWTWNYKDFAFCDDGNCSYPSEFLHFPRTPTNLRGPNHRISGYTYGVLHFQFVNWQNLIIKQAWYRCLERVNNPNLSIDFINKRYAPSKNETNLRCNNCPPEWFLYYPFYNAIDYSLPDQWRLQQVREWFDQYGQSFFSALDIWDVDWSNGTIKN